MLITMLINIKLSQMKPMIIHVSLIEEQFNLLPK